MSTRMNQIGMVGLALLFAVAIGVTMVVHAALASAAVPTNTVPPATSVTGTPDATAIHDLLVRSYAVRTSGLKTGDISQFPTVFTDDSSTSLDPDRADLIKNVRSRYGGAAQSLNGNGWLTYESARVLDRQQSLEALNRVKAAAKAQGRALTVDELRTAAGVDGQIPATGIIDHPQKVTVNTVKVTGNRADVTADDGAVTFQASLIKDAGGWRITGIKTLKTHV